MVLTFILFFLIIQECRHTTRNKQFFVLLLTAFYLIYCIVDLIYLNAELGRSFHFSDPSNYFEEASKMGAFKELLEVGKESTNIFYFVINYIYSHIYGSSSIVSLIVRFNNIALAVYAYLLVTQMTQKVSRLDFVLMMNPFLLTMIARNVRDLYILLFIVLLLLSFNMLPSKRTYSSKVKYFALAVMVTLRPVCLIPILVIILVKYTKKHKLGGVLAIMALFIVLYLYKDYILQRIVGQFISAADNVGETYEEYIALYNGDISLGSLIPFISRLVKAGVSLIFTPHPYNFSETWIGVNSINGEYGIYTKLDCVMITIGAVISYCFIIPRVITLLFTKEAYKYDSFWYAVIFSLIYATAYLGITDIRNHYIIYALFIIPMFSQLNYVKVPKKVYVIVGVIFMFLGHF